jgi:hypothetical protein
MNRFSAAGWFLDVVTNRQELAMPPKLQAEQVKGFSLYALQAVMNGRGDAILDLAKTNLLPGASAASPIPGGSSPRRGGPGRDGTARPGSRPPATTARSASSSWR